MATYSLTLRQEKGSKLTIQEMDNNWRYLDNKQSGSSSFIPNGVKIITESRDLQADDAGYFLLLRAVSYETPVILTIPEICPIPDGGVFVVINQGDGDDINNGIINIKTNGDVLKLGAGETLVYAVTNPNFCVPISTIEISDDGEYKTALRYLMDNVGGGGTPAGSDNQIQINQSGSFFADGTFQKSDTGFNLGLNHTAQSPITFTGSGLDDLALAGAFSGTLPTTYTVTIDGVNVDIISIESSTISGGTFAVGNTITNGLGGIATVNSVVQVEIGDSLEAYTYLGVTVTAGTFGISETIDNGTGVTGTGSYEAGDTFGFTDGTITYSNAPVLGGVLLSNGIKAEFANQTGHTLSDSWTWTYSTVNQNVLDFSNNDYKFQSTFGTDTYGYQIGDNLLGYGLKGSVNTYTNVAGDLGVSGLLKPGNDGIKIGNTIQLATGEEGDMTITAGNIDLSVYDGVSNETQFNINSTVFSLATDLSTIRYGIDQSAGVVSVGNISGGNNTKISIDDVNEHITISNLPAYDDDTAAGVGGLTTGMVYMTTGSGSAPLNAAGILMIKQ